MKEKGIKRNFELNPKFLKSGFKENCLNLSVTF